MSQSLALRTDALAVRRRFLRMHYEARSGHIGTGLSCIELLVYLYRQLLSADDVFILSKGHGASALYATLHHFGWLSDELLATYYQEGTLLPAHPAPGLVPRIPMATGSLGHGLPVACGVALAHRTQHRSAVRSVCMLSDGDCNEGSTWEAAAFAAHHKLDNLAVVIDNNGLQGFGRSCDVFNMEPMADKWRAFGFEVRETDGHDFDQIAAALGRPATAGVPLCVIARTRKGSGVSFMEDRLEWHYLPMTDAHYQAAIAELDAIQLRIAMDSR